MSLCKRSLCCPHLPVLSTLCCAVHSTDTITLSVSSDVLPASEQPQLQGIVRQKVQSGGMVQLTDLTIRSWPGRLNLTISSTLVPSLSIPIYVPPCRQGSVPSADGMSCDMCDQDLFSIIQPANDSFPAGTYTDGQHVFALAVRLSPLDTSTSFSPSTVGALPPPPSPPVAPSYGGGIPASSPPPTMPSPPPLPPPPPLPAANTTNSTMRCMTCPAGGKCLGGAAIMPQQGWWHSAANSTAFHTCLNAGACRDGDDEAQAILAACQSAWYMTDPPGKEPHVLQDGRKCMLWVDNSTANGTVLAVIGSSKRRALLQADNTSMSIALYTDLQCAEGYYSNLCGACEPGYFMDGTDCSQVRQYAGWAQILGPMPLLVDLPSMLGCCWLSPLCCCALTGSSRQAS